MAGRRDCRAAQAVRAPVGPAAGVGRGVRRGGDRPLDVALAGTGDGGGSSRVTGFEPLYTADEMKAAEEGHDVDAMMDRAGGAVAAAVSRDYPGARVVAVCGKGANGGDGRIAAAKLGAEVVEVGAELPKADVVIDAIFGTGFHGEPREEAARSIDAIGSAGAPVVSVDVPSGVDASTGEIAGAAVRAATTVTFHGEKV